MEEFVYLIKPIRANFIETMTDEESTIMEKHFNYLQGLLAEEKLILAGPCLDGPSEFVYLDANHGMLPNWLWKRTPLFPQALWVPNYINIVFPYYKDVNSILI